jgi:hypothetical protein
MAGVNEANFPVGTPVWTAEATTLVETQYRGLVVATGSGIVQVEHPATAGAASPVIWKPTSQVLLTYPPKDNQSSQPLATLMLSQGGTPYKVLSQTPRETVTLSYAPMPLTDWNNLRTFLVTTIRNGLDPFTLAWYDLVTAAVRTATVVLAMPALALKAPSLVLVTQDLIFLVSTDGLYT